MPDSCDVFKTGSPHGLQCLEWFMDGKIALDFSGDPDGYRRVMDVLTLHDVIWNSDLPANQSKFDGCYPFVWNRHLNSRSSNGRAMTRTCAPEDFIEQDPDIIFMTAQEMLEEILPVMEIVPLNLGTIYSV